MKLNMCQEEKEKETEQREREREKQKEIKRKKNIINPDCNIAHICVLIYDDVRE